MLRGADAYGPKPLSSFRETTVITADDKRPCAALMLTLAKTSIENVTVCVQQDGDGSREKREPPLYEAATSKLLEGSESDGRVQCECNVDLLTDWNL